MIRRIFAPDEALAAVCDQDVFGTRTMGYLKTYGTEINTVGFYAQFADGGCTAVLSDAFGHGALTVTDSADLEELREFVRFLGLHSLLCGKRTAERMHFPTDDCGHVMRYSGTEQTARYDPLTPHDAAFSYREVYDLLLLCGFSLGEYSAWLGDFALRVQKGTAKVLALRSQTTLSTASVLFESARSVYLGAVATHPDARGKGFGGDLVLRLAQCGKRAEILCKPHRVSFYESLGFSRNGEFALCPFSK